MNETTPKPITYSHSKLEIARQCMLKFKYQYVDKLPGKEEDRSAADFGEVCHFIIEHYKGGGKEELLAHYHQIVPAKIILSDKYKAKIPVALKNIHDHWKQVINQPGHVKTEPEQELTVDFRDGLKLTGKIDLLIEYTDNKWKVTDYKTSKSLKYANHRDQLAMYMLLLHLKWNIPYDRIDTDVVYLALDEFEKDGTPVLNEGYENICKTYKLDETDVECLITEINMIHTKLEKNKDTNQWKANPNKLCNWCKYKSICPAMKSEVL